MRKLQLHLVLRPGASLDELVEPLLAHTAFVARHPGSTYKVAVRDTMTAFFPLPPGRPEFDATVEIGLPRAAADDGLMQQAAALAPTIGPYIDKTMSAAVVGHEEIVNPDVGPFQLFWCMRRLPHLTHEQYLRYWLASHSEFGRYQPGRPGARQLHADLRASAIAAQAARVAIDDFDGVAQVYFGGAALFPDSRPSDAFTEATQADGALISDTPRGMGGLHHIIATIESPLVLPQKP